MVKSQTGVVGSNNKTHHTNNIQEEEDEADEYDSSSYRGKSSEQQKASNRSKHSETEQRRRSKINERFLILRNLIPQNDQKRDKASFLLEVIEYIQFLQEKLQMYEGPCQGWNQEPTKLTPWKNPQAPVEGLVDHSQVLNNGSSHETNSLLTNVQNQNSIESDMGSVVPFNIPTSSNMFAAAAGKGGLTAQSMQESVSDAENMTYQLQSPLWQGRPCATEFAAPGNAVNGRTESMNDSGSVSFSNTYSQGILDNLTQALRSSGVDLSKTSISVQIDVAKQANGGASSSKEGL